MNVYDEAHKLSQAIKESEEYKRYMEVKKKSETNPELSKMLKEFQAKQLQAQTKQMMGEEIGQDMAAQIQELYGIITKDPLAAEYLQCEMRFSMMMNDVYKILGEVIDLGQVLGNGDN